MDDRRSAIKGRLIKRLIQNLCHKYENFSRGSQIITPKAWMGSAVRRYGIGTKCRMESSRSDAWHQSEGEIHAIA